MNTVKTALRIFAILSVMLGIAYPVSITGISQAIFPRQANGSAIVKHGRIVGSELIGQMFTRDIYFHGRPSAVNYNGGSSGASNYGASEEKLIAQMTERIATIRQANQLAATQPIPVDLVTASASGLDPHISVEAALLQAPRIARARALSDEAVRALVLAHEQTRLAEQAHVNVLKLNLALDELMSKQ